MLKAFVPVLPLKLGIPPNPKLELLNAKLLSVLLPTGIIGAPPLPNLGAPERELARLSREPPGAVDPDREKEEGTLMLIEVKDEDGSGSLDELAAFPTPFICGGFLVLVVVEAPFK